MRVYIVGCGGEKATRVRVKNNTGLMMCEITIGSPFSRAERVTFTGLASGAQTEYVVVTNFVYPCSVWTIDLADYQRNVKLLHSPEQKVLRNGDHTFVIALGTDNPIKLTLEKP